jgi:hypothetical protein
MDIPPIVTTLVLQAAISILVTIINNKRQKRVEFNYDYRKYILEKRKAAYDSVQKTIDFFNQEVHLDPKDGLYSFDKGNSGFITFFITYIQMVTISMQNSTWLSPDILSKFREIIIAAKFIKSVATKETIYTKEIAEYIEICRIKHAELTNIYFSDIIQLDDIDTFKKRKEKETSDQIKIAKHAKIPWDIDQEKVKEEE